MQQMTDEGGTRSDANQPGTFQEGRQYPGLISSAGPTGRVFGSSLRQNAVDDKAMPPLRSARLEVVFKKHSPAKGTPCCKHTGKL